MKTILSIIIFLASYGATSAQTTVLADKTDDGCKVKIEQIKAKIEARRKKYEFNVQEYKQGLFCSECGRTKSEIEERAHLNFDRHILDGAAHNRHALIATEALYHNLYREYLVDFNNLKKDYEDKYNDCGGDNSSSILQIINDQQFQLYTIKLGGKTDPYNVQPGILRTEYDFYYAWMMTITIIQWKTTFITTTKFTGSAYLTNGTENAITKASNLLHNYTQTLPGKEHVFFGSIDTQPTWPLKGALSKMR